MNAKVGGIFRSARVGNSLPGILELYFTTPPSSSAWVFLSQDYFLPEFQGNLDIDDKTIAEMEERYKPEIKTFNFKMNF